MHKPTSNTPHHNFPSPTVTYLRVDLIHLEDHVADKLIAPPVRRVELREVGIGKDANQGPEAVRVLEGEVLWVE